MTLKEYIHSRTNVILIFFSINIFALCVNILGIRGEFEGTNLCYPERKPSNYFFTDSKYDYDKDSYQSNFWPFVGYFEHSDEPSKEWCQNTFYGIFRYFDYSEFLIYSLLFIIVMLRVWQNTRDKSIQQTTTNKNIDI